MSDETPPDWHSFHEKKGGHLKHAFNPNWKEADIARGVAYHAPWMDPYAGFPTHARRCALALHDAGVPVRLRSLQGQINHTQGADRQHAIALQAIQAQMRPLTKSSIAHIDVEVFQTIASDAVLMRVAGAAHHWMTPEELQATYRCRIISTVFERDRLTTEARACLARVRQVWVANRQDRDMLLGEGIEHVHVVPIPYMPDDPHLELHGRKRWPGPPRFYHIGKWEPRKEQRNILKAFLMAFKPGDAKLYMKTSMQGPRTDGYPDTPSKALHQLLEDRDVSAMGWKESNVNQSVFIIQRRLTEKQMVDLHAQSDVYVSLSRGEGFDMPAYDARIAGNPIVYTPSGGPQDFARPNDYLVPFSGKVRCHPFYGWGNDAHYGDYCIDSAVDRLCAAADAVRRGEHEFKQTLDPVFEAKFSASAVGAEMAAHIAPLRAELDETFDKIMKERQRRSVKQSE